MQNCPRILLESINWGVKLNVPSSRNQWIIRENTSRWTKITYCKFTQATLIAVCSGAPDDGMSIHFLVVLLQTTDVFCSPSSSPWKSDLVKISFILVMHQILIAIAICNHNFKNVVRSIGDGSTFQCNFERTDWTLRLCFYSLFHNIVNVESVMAFSYFLKVCHSH